MLLLNSLCINALFPSTFGKNAFYNLCGVMPIISSDFGEKLLFQLTVPIFHEINHMKLYLFCIFQEMCRNALYFIRFSLFSAVTVEMVFLSDFRHMLFSTFPADMPFFHSIFGKRHFMTLVFAEIFIRFWGKNSVQVTNFFT